MRDTGRASGAVGPGTVVVLGLLSMFGPLSLDLYLPVLPELAGDLGASASQAQLTITACLVGLAVGQVVAGPLSDRYGRAAPRCSSVSRRTSPRRSPARSPPASSPSSPSVSSRASRARRASSSPGPSPATSPRAGPCSCCSRGLALVSGLAPVLAPVLGGQLARVTSWRGTFVVLTGLASPCSSPGPWGCASRCRRGVVRPGVWARRCAGSGAAARRRFTGVVLTSGLASASMFAYIAGATFVLQELHGLSPAQFSLAFGTNAPASSR